MLGPSCSTFGWRLVLPAGAPGFFFDFLREAPFPHLLVVIAYLLHNLSNSSPFGSRAPLLSGIKAFLNQR